LSAFDILPVAEAMLIGAMALVLTGCLKMEEAYRAVDGRAIFLIAGMSSVSTAMSKTGAADLLGKLLVEHLASHGPLMVAIILHF
jgi:di/tricarboxylate transporter